MKSMRRTTFFWLAVVITAFGLAVAGVSYVWVRREAARFLDNQIRQIAFYIGDTHGGMAEPPVSHDRKNDFAIQIWDANGRLLRESCPELNIPRQPHTGFSTIHVPGDKWRTYTLVSKDRVVQISQRTSVRRALAAEEAVEDGIIIGLLVPLSWLVLGWVVQHVMGHMNRLAHRIADRDASDTQPIALADVPRELVPFVTSINGLLVKLQSVIEQQRNLISDAAHELRTPLFGLQLQADNLRALLERRPDGRAIDEEAIFDGLAALRHGVRRSSDLVNQLLRLAKYDADPAHLVAEPFNLTDLAFAGVAHADTLAGRRGLSLSVLRHEPVSVLANRNDIEAVLSNLLDNAIRYTPAGGHVEVSIFRDGMHAVVEVRDDGPGIDPAVLARVFERFFRGAPTGVEGSGLGLAIAKAAAERNHAALSLTNREGRTGIVARLRLPASLEPAQSQGLKPAA